MTNEDVLHYTYPHKPDALVLNLMHRSNTHMSFTLLIYTVDFLTEEEAFLPSTGMGVNVQYMFLSCAIR